MMRKNSRVSVGATSRAAPRAAAAEPLMEVSGTRSSWLTMPRNSARIRSAPRRALVLAGAKLLEVDSRELEAYAKPSTSWNRFDLAIYDSTASGVGHCLELFNRGEEWLKEARKILTGSQNHQSRCRRACLECILDFGGQFQADKLDRKAALDLLESVGIV